jgi:sugar phosphate isomerase/epimerase
MASLTQPIAIQSWCYRAFKTLDAFLPQLAASGATATELCGVHADFAKPESAPDTVARCRDAGVTVVAIGVEYLSGDPDKDRSRFAWCRAAGVPNMSISFKPDALDHDAAGLRAIERLAEEYDLQLGIHNHGGYDWLGNPPMLAYVLGKVGRRIGLHLDTAWAIDAKQNPVEMAERFVDRLVGVHVKDFTYSPARQPTDVIIGTGSLDLPKFADVLRAANFAGPLVIEYEGDVDNPVPALAECVAKLRAVVRR